MNMSEKTPDSVSVEVATATTQAVSTGRGDEISLLDIWAIVLRWKRLILSVTVASTVLAVAYVLFATPVYRVTVQMSVASENVFRKELAGGGSQLNSLAALAGIRLGNSGSFKETALAILVSHEFTSRFLRDEKLLPVLFSKKWDADKGRWLTADSSEIPTLWEGVKFFNRIRKVSENPKTGLVVLSIEWKNRVEAVRWANLLLKRANEQMRQRDIAEAEKSIKFLSDALAKTAVFSIQKLITQLMGNQMQRIVLANVREQYMFEVIDPAVVPPADEFVKPRRILVVILGFFGGMFFGFATALVANALRPPEGNSNTSGIGL